MNHINNTLVACLALAGLCYVTNYDHWNNSDADRLRQIRETILHKTTDFDAVRQSTCTDVRAELEEAKELGYITLSEQQIELIVGRCNSYS